MKKIPTLIILLIIMFIPLVVNGKEDNCEKISTSNEKTVEIRINQNILGMDDSNDTELSKLNFKYRITDLDDNILDETTLDKNKNIVFNCFTVSSNDIQNYKIYKIIMIDNEKVPYDYDSNIIYFSLRPNYTNGLFDPIVAYYKDDGDDESKYNIHYKKEVFHATEADLQGQAYAVLDNNTGVLTFFRDTEGKYNNEQVIDNKIYFTDFETGSSKGWTSYTLRRNIKKIVFEDAIKPISINEWFYELTNLEEINLEKLDTSEIKSFEYFLYKATKLKKVDLSTLDFSNVTTMHDAFMYSGLEALDFSLLNLNSITTRSGIYGMASHMDNLKYLNISNFGQWDDSAEFSNTPCIEKMVINDVFQFYRTNIDGVGPDFWYKPSEKQLYTSQQIKNNLYNHSKEMAGYYIRPTCTNSAAFSIKYNPSKIKHSISVVNVKETDDLLVEVEDIRNVGYKELVRFIVKPIDGYIIEKIIITDSNDNIIEYKKLDKDNKYEFIMPDTDVTIKPQYKKIDSKILNPNTKRQILLIVISVIILSIMTFIYYKKKKK